MRRRALSLGFITILVICTSYAGVNRGETQEKVEIEDYAVYSAAINTLSAGIPSSLLMIQDRTFPQPSPRPVRTELVPAGVLEDFQIKNQQVYHLDRHFDLPNKYHLLSESEYSDIFQSSPIITLSRVGFNSTKDVALLYLEFGKGAIAQKGYYVLLNKLKGRWRVQEKVAIISGRSS